MLVSSIVIEIKILLIDQILDRVMCHPLCLNGNCSKVCKGKHLSDTSPIPNGLKQGDASFLLLFDFSFEYAIKKVQEKQVVLKLNGTHELLVYADDANLLGVT
jgi:hypothetical protein